MRFRNVREVHAAYKASKETNPKDFIRDMIGRYPPDKKESELYYKWYTQRFKR